MVLGVLFNNMRAPSGDAAARERAPDTQEDGQRQGDMIVLPENADKLKSGDVASIVGPRE